MVWLWLILFIVICVGGGIGQYYWNKHHPNALHFTPRRTKDDDDMEFPWEGY
jgi:hypothetical protein